MRKTTPLLALAALALSACAFGDETLTLTVEDTLRPGLLQEARPTTVALAPVNDGRANVDPVGKPDHKAKQKPVFVGYKRNGYGQKTANIVADRPVSAVVEDAVSTMLEQNGHSVGDSGPLSLEVSVTSFDLDMKTGFVAVEFIGSVEADVVLRDRLTGEPLYSSSFRGNETRKQGGGLAGTWENVLTEALNDMVRQISLTPEIKDAFDAVGGQPAISAVELDLAA